MSICVYCVLYSAMTGLLIDFQSSNYKTKERALATATVKCRQRIYLVILYLLFPIHPSTYIYNI